jgi:hypothetical protein
MVCLRDLDCAALHRGYESREILGDGQGTHWPEVDEDISVEGMLYGAPAQRRPDRTKNAA